jgi:hypothetical protein
MAAFSRTGAVDRRESREAVVPVNVALAGGAAVAFGQVDAAEAAFTAGDERIDAAGRS